jgi:uncharacterized RDD family membrane protein YckC
VSASEPEEAVRWRCGAAVIDNFVVYAGYVLVCAVLGWRALALDHLWLLIVAGAGYHFALEARDGQTVGKRHYGIQVVSVDGDKATPKAVAIRSGLRLIDQLPLFYASGLISMVRTGPARRQRLGDVVAGTKVVGVGGHALAKGTPGWLLPVATLTAVIASVAVIVVGTRSTDSPLNSTERAGFIDACGRSPYGQVMDCTCFLDQLVAAGYATPNALRQIGQESADEEAVGQFGAARSALRNAVQSCAR